MKSWMFHLYDHLAGARRSGGEGPAMGNNGDCCSDDASGDCCVAARSWELWCRVVYVTLRCWAPWYHPLPPGTCP